MIHTDSLHLGDQLDLILPGDPRFKDEAVGLRTLAEQQDEFDERCAELFDEQDYYLKHFGMEKYGIYNGGITNTNQE